MRKKRSVEIEVELFGSIKKKKNALGFNTVLRTFKVSELYIDEEYQRPCRISRCKRIAENFSEDAADIPLVSKRKGTKMLFILNGQHTITARQLLGENEVTVKFLTKETTLDEERAIFEAYNNEIRTIHSNLKLYNRYKSGDKILCDITDIANVYDLKAGWESDRKEKNKIYCTAALERLYLYDDGVTLDVTLNFISQSWLSNDSDRELNMDTVIKDKFITAVFNIFRKHSDVFSKQSAIKRLITKCSTKTAKFIVAIGETHYEGLSGAILSLYNKGIKADSRLFMEE